MGKVHSAKWLQQFIPSFDKRRKKTVFALSLALSLAPIGQCKCVCARCVSMYARVWVSIDKKLNKYLWIHSSVTSLTKHATSHAQHMAHTLISIFVCLLFLSCILASNRLYDISFKFFEVFFNMNFYISYGIHTVCDVKFWHWNFWHDFFFVHFIQSTNSPSIIMGLHSLWALHVRVHHKFGRKHWMAIRCGFIASMLKMRSPISSINLCAETKKKHMACHYAATLKLILMITLLANSSICRITQTLEWTQIWIWK